MHSAQPPVMRDGRNLSFILNPRSRNYFPAFKDIAAAKWPLSKFYVSSDEKELFEFGRIAARNHRKRTPVVVACGGDGTFRAVASAVVNNAILGIVPMGTVNLVAYQLGIPKDIHSAIELLERGRLSYIYPGCCSWDGSDVCRLFFISVSMGADADAVHCVSPRLKVLFGKISYAVSFLDRLLRHPLPRIEYTLNGNRAHSNGIIAVSSGFYGGKNTISTSQNLHKPGTEIISLHHGKTKILGFFLALFLGVGRCTDFASFNTGTHLEMSCPPHGRFQIDGDKLSAKKIIIRPMDTPLAVIANRPVDCTVHASL